MTIEEYFDDNHGVICATKEEIDFDDKSHSSDQPYEDFCDRFLFGGAEPVCIGCSECLEIL